MGPHPFIFSNELHYRLRRHLAFWGLWWFSQAILYSFIVELPPGKYLYSLALAMVNAAGFMVPHIFLSYSLMYFVIPRYLLKDKYIISAVTTLVLFFLTGVVSAMMAIYALPSMRAAIGIYYIHSTERSFGMALLGGLRGAVTIGGVAAAIKLMKYWYVKQARNLELQKENIAGQLQLLKGQVHPHFLFNTLNNMYAHAQVGSASAPVLIAGLSDLLRYMLYEGNQPLVPFEKELKMIKDYFVLEQVRYGNKLDVNLELPANTEGLYIAPLLLLPFVENCFKHGTSHVLDQPWISLRITVEEERMKMKLLNGKATEVTSTTSAGGIGIANVMRRLDLLYPQKHQLNIKDDTDVFIVNLQLQLERRLKTETSPLKDNNLNYAHSPS
ncbi:MAG TPA: histidine kinase [Puia sp.]